MARRASTTVQERRLLEDLRRLARARAIHLGGQARGRKEGMPLWETPEGSDELQRLEKVIATLERKPPSLRRRRLVFGTVAASVVLVGWLLLSRIGETPVFLELQLSEATFDLTDDRTLLGVTGAAALSIVGLAGAELPLLGAAPMGAAVGASPGPQSLAIASREGGRLSLGGLPLGAGTRVTVLATARPQVLRIIFRGPASSLRATVDGPARFDTVGEVDLPSPQPVLLKTRENTPVVLELTPSDGPTVDLAPGFPVSNLVLHRLSEEYVGRQSRVRSESTVLGGTLVLEEIDSTERRLRLGEPLTFERSAGVIQALRFRDGRWLLDFQGTVAGMRAGHQDHRRSEMPTRGRWLQAHHGAWLLWGAAVYGIGLAYGVLRWLGIEI